MGARRGLAQNQQGEHDGLSVAFAQAHVLAFQNGALFGKALGIGLGAAYRGHEHGRTDAGVGGRRAGSERGMKPPITYIIIHTGKMANKRVFFKLKIGNKNKFF